MRIVSLRLDDAQFAAVEAGAKDAGLSRSAFIKRQLPSAEPDDLRPIAEGAVDRGGRVRVQVRIGKKQYEALRADAAQQHLLPSDIVRELIHARYYDGGETALFYGEAARKAAFSIRAEINPIGRNVNNAARRLLAAVNDGDPREMVERAEELAEMRENVVAVMQHGQDAIERMASADYRYWANVK